jgi:long-subunit acyl-CoA synthetase (AMP-forming)
VKVLTHRPRYIEPVVVPEFGAGSTPATEATLSASITQSAEEPTVMPKTHTVKAVEDKIDTAEGSKAEMMQVPKILSPPTEATLPKVQKTSAATPKRRRMANMLDAMLETTKALSPAPAKKVAQTEAKS